MGEQFDVVIVGGGQALAASYFLRRTGLRYVILDNGTGGWCGAWLGPFHRPRPRLQFSPLAADARHAGWRSTHRDECLTICTATKRAMRRRSPPMVGRVERTDQKF
jgi:cation diffusion facilitator CzcD-associated flavoprotein CzcO